MKTKLYKICYEVKDANGKSKTEVYHILTDNLMKTIDEIQTLYKGNIKSVNNLRFVTREFN